jgi:hypothetical protein
VQQAREAAERERKNDPATHTVSLAVLDTVISEQPRTVLEAEVVSSKASG